MQIVVTSIVSDAASGIPFIGSFSSDIISQIQTMYEEVIKDKMRQEALDTEANLESYGRSNILDDTDEQIELLHMHGMNLIHRRITELAVELSRIFKYHICMIKNTGHIKKMAIHAATRILSMQVAIHD